MKTMMEFPPFRLDLANQCLWCRADGAKEHRILLTPKSFDLLRYLLERPGHLVTQEELLNALWPKTFVQPEVLKGHIRDIRAALGDDPKKPRFIETLHRRGYRFIAPLRDVSRESGLDMNPAIARLVGRDLETNWLRESLYRALRGERQLVFVTGESGIGKTALVDSFQRQIVTETPHLRIARGQCVEGYGGKEPYFPILEALSQLCRGPAGDSVVPIIASQAPTWLVQMPAFVRREQRESLQREILGATRERMLREIADALETITAEFPLLLVLEDLHWVDPSTVDLISVLARRRQPAKLVLIGTYRPVEVLLSQVPLKGLKHELSAHGLCQEIIPHPLDETEIAEFLIAESPDGAIPEGLAGLLFRHCEGNPLFMVAALECLRERSRIVVENGSWRMNCPIEEIDVEAPETLRQMIEIQIERMDAEHQRVLEVASISGVVFDVNVSAAAAGMDAEKYEDLCEELSRRNGMVRLTTAGPLPEQTLSVQYEFVHALYREVLYRRQAPVRRIKLHQRIGERLETRYAGQLGDFGAMELASHFEEACDWARAVKYLRLAAGNASRRFARREAMAMLQRALDLSNRLPETDRVETETATLETQALMWAVSFDTLAPAVEAYEAMALRAREHGLIGVEVRALIGMAYPLHWFDSMRCFEVAEKALQLSLMQPDMLLQAGARTTCYYWRLWAGGWDNRDFKEFENALAELRLAAGENRAVYALDLIGYGLLQWCSSRYRDAHRSATEGFSIALEAGDRNPYFNTAYQRATLVLPWCLLFMGEWGEAIRDVKASVAMMNRNGDQFRAQAVEMFDAWVRLHAMDFEAVSATCQSALRLFKDPVRSAYSRFCLMLEGQAETGLGNYERALEYLSAARDALDSKTVINTWFLRMHLESAITDLWLSKGDLARARPQAEHSLQIAQAAPDRTWQALAWGASSKVAMADGDMKHARVCIAEALSRMKGYEVPLAAWRVYATAAEFYERMGNNRSAKHYRKLSCETILKLADSLPAEEAALRKTFLSAPPISAILANVPSSRDRNGNPILVSKERYS